jgi:2-keto-3-deoxy-L-rhamnonate aldolase RhmA
VKTFVARARARERLRGTVVALPDPVLTELVGAAFAFVGLDLEHGAPDVGDIPLATGLRAAGTAALVRLSRSDTERLRAVMDSGADAVVAPRIESAPEAEALVSRLRYPPLGTRGFGPRRANGYGRAGSSGEVGCVVQIESARGVEAASEIAVVDGVDAIVVGTADLFFDLGSPGDLESPVVREAVESTRVAAEEGGPAFGVAAGDASAIARLCRDTGVIGVLAVDVRLDAGAVDAAAVALAGAFAAPPLEAQY